MNREKVLLIIRREYVESVRKKSFLFGLVATPLIFVAAVFLPILGEGMLSDDSATLAVRDLTGTYGERLRQDLASESTPTLTVWGPEQGPSPLTLDAMVSAGDLDGWILLPADFAETGTVEYHAKTVLDRTTLQDLENRIGRILSERRAAEAGLALPEVERVLRPVDLKVFRLGDDGEETNPDTLYLHAVVLVMMLFFALLPTGQILMRSVIEEKANRVVEVLLSSVTPKELMIGKVIGLGAVGLTMLGAWTGVGVILSLKTGRALPVGPAEAGVFLLYFFPGYFLYAALLGAIGSICNAERDAQPFLTPISLMLVLPILLGFAIAQNPDHVIARVASFFPLFTPSLMLFRYVIQPPPLWEMAATWATLVGGTAAMFWISSRVFRIGILMTGKRPTFPEIARWVRAR